MTTFKLPYVQAFPDRHRKQRYYFRRPGQKLRPLSGVPGSAEFMTAYQAALSGTTAPLRKPGADRTKPGSLNWLCVEYYTATEFVQLRDITKSSYKNVIERLRRDYGDLPFKELAPKHIRKILDRFADRPGAAYNFLRVIRILMRFAVDRGLREGNPTIGIRRPKRRSSGFRPWTDADIEKFEAAWPSGSMPRLALALLLYTGQRRADVACMGRQHLGNGCIIVRQQKSGTGLTIPLHHNLQRELDNIPDRLTFVLTRWGRPYTPAGFTNWFSACAKKAGLPANSTPHGLRKAAAIRLAENGCTAHEIMAITGHKTLSQVDVYTLGAEQKRLARRAVENMT